MKPCFVYRGNEDRIIGEIDEKRRKKYGTNLDFTYTNR